MLVVLFKKALVSICSFKGESGSVQQTIEYREALKKVLFKDGFKVKLQIGQTSDILNISQETQNPAVGDKTPQDIPAVEELLHKGMRRKPWSTTLCHATQFLAHTHNMYWWGVICFTCTVGNGKGEPVNIVGFAVVVQFIPQKAKKGYDPCVSGY